MLRITIPSIELYDEEKNEFSQSKSYVLDLEHSLVSVSKWESKWCKPFLTKSQKTVAETIDYIRCMTVTQNVDPEAYEHITDSIVKEITAYIDAPMTATTFSKDRKKPSFEIITSEIIYYWMVTMNIPFECQRWHLNRLLALINVCNLKNGPQRKMSRKEVIERNRALNEARRREFNTSG